MSAQRRGTGADSATQEKPRAQKEHVHGPHCNHSHDVICEFRIRHYKKEDYKQLRAVWKISGIGLDDTDKAASIHANLKRNSHGYRVFVIEAQMVDQKKKTPVSDARIGGGVITTFDGHRAYIYHLAVHPDFRGVGLGRALLDTCERQAKLWNAKHLRLSARTDKSRAPAHQIYKTSGWIADDTIWTYKKTL